MLTKNDVIRVGGNNIPIIISVYLKIIKNRVLVTFSTAINDFYISKDFVVKETFNEEYNSFLNEVDTQYSLFLKTETKLKNKGFVTFVPAV